MIRVKFTPFLVLRFLVLLAFGVPASVRAAESAPASPAPSTSATLVALSPDRADAVLAEIAAKMGEVKSFSATFTQDHHLAMYLDVLKARGRCFFAAPDKFRWELLAPYRSILVFNHDRVAKFEEKDGAMKYVASGAYDVIRGLMSQMTGWMRGDFKASQDAFAMTLFEGGKELQLQLTPRSKEMLQYVQRIEVTLSKSPLQTTRIVIREPEQDYIEIRFANVRENAALDPKTFDTKNPLVLALPNEKK